MVSSIQLRPYGADGGDHPTTYTISTEESLECPFCFSHIEIQTLRGVFWSKNNKLQIFLKCKKCNNCFIGDTRLIANIFHIISLSKGNKKTREFQKEINELSPNFAKIYGESEVAEQENLTEICGVGYRKSLEFLIKDYLINKFSEKTEEIKEKALGACINEMIENSRIKEISSRANWLGNDETHYFRKWEGKDLEDLKKLIEITVHFISMEIQADKYMAEMSN